MYFEFESCAPVVPHVSAHMSANAGHAWSEPSLRPRHRRLSASSHSLTELLSEENVIENITPSQCDLYLITRKKLSAMTTSTSGQQSDLRREVLLASIHRNITANPVKCVSHDESIGSLNKDKVALNHHQNSPQRDQHFKSALLSSTTSTSTTTIANTTGATKLTSTNITISMPSSHKKRSSPASQSSSPPTSDYEEEWKTTIKRLKVVHGLDFSFDVAMDSECEERCDSDLNDLTNNFHRLKTTFI